jgi:hypothetical protein
MKYLIVLCLALVALSACADRRNCSQDEWLINPGCK